MNEPQKKNTSTKTQKKKRNELEKGLAGNERASFLTG